MKKTILSITLASILGIGLVGCGTGASEIVNDANNFTKDKVSQDFKDATKQKLIKSYDGKYLPLYDATNGTKESVKFYDNLSKADLYDVTSGTLLAHDVDVTISLDGKTLMLKDLYGANQDLVFSITKKDGSQFLTKGNTTWDTGITCNKLDEVENKIEQIKQDITKKLQEPEDGGKTTSYVSLNANDMTYYLYADAENVDNYITDNGNLSFGEMHFSKDGIVTIIVNNEQIYNGAYHKEVIYDTDENNNPIGKPSEVIYVDGAEISIVVAGYIHDVFYSTGVLNESSNNNDIIKALDTNNEGNDFGVLFKKK